MDAVNALNRNWSRLMRFDLTAPLTDHNLLFMAIHLAAIPYFYHHNAQSAVFDSADDAVITNAVFPELA